MTETLKFHLAHRIKTHSDMFLSSSDGAAFVKLCRAAKIRLIGFEGFHLFPDNSIQIDQDFSADYLDTDVETAYELALKFFDEHKEDGVAYEFIYDGLDKDSEIIKAHDAKEASWTGNTA